jgi:hypothetical protein
VVLLAEVRAECAYVRHHKQKIALVPSQPPFLQRDQPHATEASRRTPGRYLGV